MEESSTFQEDSNLYLNQEAQGFLKKQLNGLFPVNFRFCWYRFYGHTSPIYRYYFSTLNSMSGSINNDGYGVRFLSAIYIIIALFYFFSPFIIYFSFHQN
jgi:hypothetical protein